MVCTSVARFHFGVCDRPGKRQNVCEGNVLEGKCKVSKKKKMHSAILLSVSLSSIERHWKKVELNVQKPLEAAVGVTEFLLFYILCEEKV